MVLESVNEYEQILVPRQEMPLCDRRVMFTTPRNYAADLGRLLLQRGARTIWLPTIEIWPMDDTREIDDAIRNLDGFNWVAFTSENGVKAFCERFQSLGFIRSSVAGTKFASFKADMQILEEYGLSADLVPGPFGPTGIVDELKRLGVTGGTILVPCPEVVGVPEPYVVPQFIENLKRIGMKVTRLDAYRTIAVKNSGSLEKEMLFNNQIDCLVFTSSAEILSFLEQLGERRDVLNHVPLAYMGSYTAKTGHELGLRLDIVPENFTMRGLVGAVEKYFR
ncbi:MAG: hypothetical protein CL798_08940 [Chromatiales bacterium]|nr:hypothetical protein [Chromatiales bacterium]